MNNLLQMLIKRSRGATAPVPIPTDYAFYAPLSEDYADHSSNHVTMHYKGNYAPDFMLKEGRRCACLYNNCGLYSDTATAINTGNHAHTISFWMKVNFSGSFSDWPYVFAVGKTGQASGSLIMYVNPNNKTVITGIDKKYDDGSWYPDTNWHHYVIRYGYPTSPYGDFWVDGVKQSTFTNNELDIPNDRHIGIGMGNSDTAPMSMVNKFFASFRVYERILTTGEIKALYHEEFIPQSDLVFHAPLTTDFQDIAYGRTYVNVGTGLVQQTTRDGRACSYIASEARMQYTPSANLPLGNSAKTVAIWVDMDFTNSGWNACLAFGNTSQNYQLFCLGCSHNWIESFTAYWADLDYGTSQLHAGWNHLAATWDGTYIRLYHDGQLVGTKALGVQLNTAINALCIGGRPTNSDNYCESAYFYDARVYNRCLTADEIAYLASLDQSESISASESQSHSESQSQSGDPSLLWHTPFKTDYTELVSGIAGQPTSNNICEIVADDRFGGYLNMHKYNGSSLTGLQYPNTQNALQLGTGNWSIAFWLNAPQWNNYGQAIISHRGNGTGFDSKDGFVIFKDSNYTMDMRIGANSNQAKSSDVPTDNTWHHWVFIHYSDHEWEWYMDGEVVTAETGWTGDNATSNGNVNVFIGGDGDWGKSAVFKLADLRIYNRYLEWYEIADLYHMYDEQSESVSESASISESQSISESESVIPLEPDIIGDAIFNVPLAESFRDVTGGREATLIGEPVLTTKDGFACAYIPYNSKVEYPWGDLASGDDARSYSVWVYKTDETNTGWDSVLYSGHNSDNQMFTVGIRERQYASFFGYNNDVISTGVLTSGWNHIVITYADNNLKIYLNNALVNDSTITSLNTQETAIYLNGRNQSPDEFGNSKWIFGAKIYNRELTSDEVTTLYHEYMDDGDPSESISESESESESVLPVEIPTDYTKYYPLATDLTDAKHSGTSYDLVKGTGVSVSHTTSSGIACATVGSNGCLYNTAVGGDRTNGCCLSAWVRLTGTPSGSTLKVLVNGSANSAGHGFWVGHRSQKFVAGYGTTAAITTDVAVNLKWHHLLLNYDKDNLTVDFWIDGVKQGTKTVTSALSSSAGTVINAMQAAKTNPDYLNDVMTRYADVKYFNRTLSDAEIRGLAGEH